MNTSVEDRLSTAMQSQEGRDVGGWDEIVSAADRVRRRDSLVQRAAVVCFIAGLATLFVLVIGTSSTVETDPPEPADLAQSPDEIATIARFSWLHLAPGLALVVLLVVLAVASARHRVRPLQAPTGWRRYWFVASLVPMLYGPALVLALLVDSSGQGPVVFVAAVLKWISLPIVPLLIALLSQRAGELGGRPMTLMGVWVLLGVAVLLTARGLIVDIVEFGIDRLWPGLNDDPELLRVLDNPPGADWHPGRILTTELAAVVAIAVMSGMLIRFMQRLPKVAAVVVPVAVFAALSIYNEVAPYGFAFDFDPFWGDLVLGGVYSELLLAVFPLDPIGALAISAAVASMVVMLWLWGGPVPAPIADNDDGGSLGGG